MLSKIKKMRATDESYAPTVTPGHVRPCDAVEEAFKVLSDPKMPMVERVREGRHILSQADTPTKLIENARLGKSHFDAIFIT